MTAREKECMIHANKYLLMVLEMGKCIYDKAWCDHMSFLSIVKSGAAALTIAQKEKAKMELDLKKHRPPLQTGPITISSSFPRSMQMKPFKAWRKLKRRAKRPLGSWRRGMKSSRRT
jgi:hypothetical protein